jgi:hypothetical protein
MRNERTDMIVYILRSVALAGLLALFFVGISAQDTMRTWRDTSRSGPDSTRAADPISTGPESSAGPTMEFRKVENKAFGVGERLEFDVSFGFVKAGVAVMEIPTRVSFNGRECYRVEFRVNSLPFFSVFYRVEDRYTSLIDVEGLFPWQFEQRIREGGYARDFSAQFDHENLLARTSEGDYRIPQFVHDVVSAFYFTRTIDFSGFTPGQKIHLENFYKDSTYRLDVRFRGKQTVKVEAGTFNCIIIEPLVKEGGLFKSEGSILVWLTDDDRRVPIMVRSKIVIGTISAELREYSGVNGPITAKVTNSK